MNQFEKRYLRPFAENTRIEWRKKTFIIYLQPGQLFHALMLEKYDESVAAKKYRRHTTSTYTNNILI